VYKCAPKYRCTVHKNKIKQNNTNWDKQPIRGTLIERVMKKFMKRVIERAMKMVKLKRAYHVGERVGAALAAKVSWFQTHLAFPFC